MKVSPKIPFVTVLVSSPFSYLILDLSVRRVAEWRNVLSLDLVPPIHWNHLPSVLSSLKYPLHHVSFTSVQHPTHYPCRFVS